VSQPALTEFSGVAGRVLRGSVSGGSLITGMVVGFALLAGNAVLIMAEAPSVATPFTQIVLALALARFAVNGLHGEWGGTIFSGAGGPWSRVVQVALRYLCLTALWLLPMLLLGVGLEQGAAMGMGVMSGKLAAFALIYMLAMTLTPPMFLIVAVSATGFGDIFTPDHWKGIFGGRLGDLFAVYVVYTGTLAMVLVLSLPPVAMAFNMNPKLGFLIAGLSFCMLFGVSVNLLGRLSGFFACGELGLFAPAAPESTDRMPASVAVASEPKAAVPTSTAEKPLPDPPQGLQAAQPSVVPDLRAASPAEKLPPLLDGQQRVEMELKRFPKDPYGALAALKELYQSFAPHPNVMQALAICLYRTDQREPAIELANRALPLCLERGYFHLGAGIFTEMKRELDRLKLDRNQLLLIASSLIRMDDLAAAAKAYSAVIGGHPEETRAIKGLLQVAEQIMNQRPEAAAKVYRYLLEHCASSPLAEFMTRGLAEAERGMEQQASRV
jgi:hypothetical protein